MFNSKYSNFLTILLIIVIIAIFGIIGFLGFKYFQSYKIEKDASEFVDSYTKPTEKPSVDIPKDENDENSEIVIDGVEGTTNNNSSGSTSVQKYKGFTIVGSIRIPKIDIQYPIISDKELSKTAIEVAVSMLYGPGPNQVGNTVIIGHNYRNGKFFSNLKNLSIGDKIYITDITDNVKHEYSYTIYNKYETTDTDTEYITRDTNGAREISLSTCTDDVKARLIIWAKCDLDQ